MDEIIIMSLAKIVVCTISISSKPLLTLCLHLHAYIFPERRLEPPAYLHVLMHAHITYISRQISMFSLSNMISCAGTIAR